MVRKSDRKGIEMLRNMVQGKRKQTRERDSRIRRRGGEGGGVIDEAEKEQGERQQERR